MFVPRRAGGGGSSAARVRAVLLALVLGLAGSGWVGVAAPAAAQSACAAAAANAVIWADGYDLRVASEDGLYLRSGPGTKCKRLGGLDYGATVEVTGEPVWADGEEWVPVSTYLGDGFVWTGGLGPVIEDAAPAVPAGPPATSVPVLMYHRINEYPSQYETTVDTLYQHVAWLSANGYTAITPSDLIAAIDGDVPLPPKPVMLTVDDGNVSSLTFAAVFAEYGFEGTYFIPTEAVSRIGEEGVAYLAQTGEVCGHTVDHANLPWYTPDGQWYQVYQNKVWLEAVTGQTITCFAYPYGAYDWATTDIVAGSGYAVAFNAWGGIAHLAGLDRYHVPRIEVHGWMTVDELAASL